MYEEQMRAAQGEWLRVHQAQVHRVENPHSVVMSS
jgi:hypothetical protein